MRDKFDENSVTLLTKSDGSDVDVGDLVVYHDSTKKDLHGNPWRAIHEISATSKTHFIGNGVSNRHSDAWSPKSGIEWKANIVKYPPPSAPAPAQPAQQPSENQTKP
jgi:hypothetical protein